MSPSDPHGPDPLIDYPSCAVNLQIPYKKEEDELQV